MKKQYIKPENRIIDMELCDLIADSQLGIGEGGGSGSVGAKDMEFILDVDDDWSADDLF